MKKLFTALHGSRSYGLDSPSSDYDYKFVWVEPLKLFPDKDCKEYSEGEDRNYVGYSLQKFLMLLSKGNNQPYEWVAASNDCPGYVRKFVYEQTARKLFPFFMCYYGMVINDYKEYHNFLQDPTRNKRNLKNILTMVRSLGTMYFVWKNKELPPLKFDVLYDLLRKDKFLSPKTFTMIDECLDKKRLDNYTGIKYDVQELRDKAEILKNFASLPNLETDKNNFEEFFKLVLDFE